jgi:hypothetical protein
MDLMPDILAFADEKSFPKLQNSDTKAPQKALLGTRSTTIPVYNWGTNDGCLHASRVRLGGVEHDLVDVAVYGVRGHMEQLAHAFPVVVFLGTLDAERTSA